MRVFSKMRFISLLLTISMVGILATPIKSMAAPLTVDLRTTIAGFAVLAGQTITNTGTTTISGSVGANMGVSPGSAFTGKPSVTMSGAVHLADDVALTAQNELIIAYDDAAGRTPETTISSELGGLTLIPGTYVSASGYFHITGTLTLDAQGQSEDAFIFKTTSTLITASGSNIELKNSARFCRTFWKVGSSATLGTYSHFEGHIFALTSITAMNSASVQGQLLARNGAVTLDNNTITNGTCDTTSTTPPTQAPATLHVIKHVINDNGGKSIAANFNLHVKTSGSDVVESPAPGAESPGTTYTLSPGTYIVSEDTTVGYTQSYSNNNDLSGNIIVALGSGDNKTVTITNNDNSVVATPPAVVTPPVPVTKTVTGGKLPNSSTHLYELLLMGTALMLVGVIGWRSRKRYE
ncbi:MAG TPA: ice-binding family protein [Clostridiaceae bacterium]